MEAEGAPAEEVEQTTELLSKTFNVNEGSRKISVEDQGASQNLLSIVASQRERFRKKVVELETQNLQQQEQLTGLQGEVEQIRADNVKLYGKIKFLQSYQGQKHQKVSVPVDSDAFDRYSSEYERHLDPFRNFTMQEKQRKYGQLRAHDKAALGLGRWVMSSSQTRAIFFIYLLFLHMLVFGVLYRVAYVESCKRDFAADCVDKFRQHMHQVHGDADFHG